jgi:hypothetical protein
MIRECVSSTNIKAIGYDAVRAELEVEFLPNRHGQAVVWVYRPVTIAEFEELRSAPSIGKALNMIRFREATDSEKVATIVDGVETRLG